MRERNTTLVPILAYFYRIATIGESLGSPAYAVRKAKEVVEAHMKSFALAMRMGLTIGMGTDFEGTVLFPHGENATEFELMVQGGMAERDVIVAATATNAAILGIEKKVGTIEKGKLADLIAVPGDPLKDIARLRHAEFVMQEGRIARSNVEGVAEELLAA
jgi:imidazolonepropionase-like amidohydrolase